MPREDNLNSLREVRERKRLYTVSHRMESDCMLVIPTDPWSQMARKKVLCHNNAGQARTTAKGAAPRKDCEKA